MSYEEKLAEQERFRQIKQNCTLYKSKRHTGTSGAVSFYDECKQVKRQCRVDICPCMKEQADNRGNIGQ